ncbi:MAG: Glu-tRNA(Gln) amidotransferase subunit GatE [Candidatus Diapherotrites archaeon]|nr:Glu-tRNA(Gln) amidotransferase subunit GatE [Candidatus Diapherotrites archaeon]
MQTDCQKLGFKCGLEVHQQLDTGKLFIRNKSVLSDELNFTVERKLRPVASELGEFDRAAIDAFRRGETFHYSGNTENISLIEIDEEPPQPLNKTALETALEIALLCESSPVSKAIVMRKTVIDGSNTSAFQRTMLVSLGGSLEVNGKKIGVEQIVLEEDAARPIKKEHGMVHYNLDRLGIPLVEFTTAPDIKSPEETAEVAGKIGEIMRLTGRTKRGKGTIRQDVNISIANGARCEIKGCQELELLGTVVEKEVERQLDLLELKKKLCQSFASQKTKQPDTQNIFGAPKEISDAFANTEAKFVRGKKWFGMRLKEMKGILGTKVGAKRFGTELSNCAKAAGVSGLLHRDELPAYGISESEVETVLNELECNKNDSFIIIAAEKEKAERAFEEIKKRILIAFERVPEETRGALEDGSSEYQRPLAGEARMYPETDLHEEEISEKLLKEIRKKLPKSAEQRKKHYIKSGLSEQLAEKMKLSNYARFFEEAVESGANPKTSAALLLELLVELKREGINTDEINLKEIKELLVAEAKEKIGKSHLRQAIIELSRGKSAQEIISGQKKIDEKEIGAKIREVVEKNAALVKARGMDAIKPLMGDLMKDPALRGTDGKMLSELLKKEIGGNRQ